MVQISIHALKNLNHGGRFYPYSGFLGLTKVLVEGVARTRIEDDHKLLPAFSITVSVKCYEARAKLTDSRVNILAEVTQTLWSSVTDDSSEIGDMDLPFRLVLPANIGGYSTMSFPDYKIFWRLEAVINHPPQFGLGMRQIRTYELALTRYSSPSQSPLPLTSEQQPPNLPGYRSSPSSSPRVPQFFYRVIDPAHPVGPGDEYPTSISLVPSDQHPTVHFQSLSISLERRVQLYEASGANTSTENIATSTPTPSPSIASTSGAFANLSPSHNQTIALTRKRSASSSSDPVVLPAKSMSSSLVSGQTTEFKADGAGGTTASLKLPLPARPSLSHWPVGESLQTDLARIYFVLRIKIVITSSSGTTEVELEPSEIQLAAVSQEQRSAAAAKITRRKVTSKSASSSRRTSLSPSTSGSSKAEPDTPPPIPPTKQSRSSVSSTSILRAYASTGTPEPSSESSNAPSSRPVHPDYRSPRNSARPSSKRRSQISSVSASGSSPPVSGNTRSTRASSIGITIPLDLKKMPSHIVRAWEEELHRIVTRSKRKSEDMWGSNGNCDHMHRRARPRRSIAASPPSAFTHPYNHPSDTEPFSRYSAVTKSDNSIISPIV